MPAQMTRAACVLLAPVWEVSNCGRGLLGLFQERLPTRQRFRNNNHHVTEVDLELGFGRGRCQRRAGGLVSAASSALFAFIVLLLIIESRC